MIGRPGGRALLLGGVVAVVLVVVGVALYVLGPPEQERRQRLDAQRIADLQEIAQAVDRYRAAEGALPPDLEALAGWRGFEPPHADPETQTPYRYRVVEGDAYELCATFATEEPPGENRRSTYRHGTYWQHPAGDHCFELEAQQEEEKR